MTLKRILVYILAVLFFGSAAFAQSFASTSGDVAPTTRLSRRLLGRHLLTPSPISEEKKSDDDEKKDTGKSDEEADCAKKMCKDSKKDKKKCEATAFECTKALKQGAKAMKNHDEKDLAKKIRSTLETFTDKSKKVESIKSIITEEFKKCDIKEFQTGLEQLGKAAKGKKDESAPDKIRKLKGYDKMTECLQNMFKAVDKADTKKKSLEYRRLMGGLVRGARPAMVFSFGWGAAALGSLGSSANFVVSATQAPRIYYTRTIGRETSFGFNVGLGVSLLRDVRRVEGVSMTGTLGGNLGIVGGNVGVVLTEDDQNQGGGGGAPDLRWEGLTFGVNTGLNVAPPVSIGLVESLTEPWDGGSEDDGNDGGGDEFGQVWASCLMFTVGGFGMAQLLRWSFSTEESLNTYKEVV